MSLSYSLFLNESSQPANNFPDHTTPEVKPAEVKVVCKTPGVKCPKDYLKRSIVALILFFPLGILALYKSRQVHKFHEAGEFNKALDKSQGAKVWSFIGTVIGLCAWVFGALYCIIFFGLEQGP